MPGRTLHGLGSDRGSRKRPRRAVDDQDGEDGEDQDVIDVQQRMSSLRQDAVWTPSRFFGLDMRPFQYPAYVQRRGNEFACPQRRNRPVAGETRHQARRVSWLLSCWLLLVVSVWSWLLL